MIRKLDHLVITTEHPVACLAFYRALGFEVREAAARWELFAGDFKINVHLKGEELSPHAGVIQPGGADLCFEIDGRLEEFRSELIGKGRKIETQVVSRTGARGPMRSFYLRDPDGNLIEFCSYR